MKPFFHYAVVSLFFIVSSCSVIRDGGTASDDGKIEVVFVQVNDVYEIAPLSGGKEGGMARVATLKKEYSRVNSNTFLVMAGDFLSPSVYNSLQYEGKRIRGRQMVEAMNAAAMDWVVFGNHEFDINENELLERINESQFQWIASNVFHKQKDKVIPFVKTSSAPVALPQTLIQTVRDKDGTTVKIGFIGLTLPFNKADYVSYTDALTTAKELYGRLKDSVDAVVAITHQSVEEDKALAKAVPGLAVILGGHEHDMRLEKEGNIYITKAHANAKSAFVVTMTINKKKKRLKVDPRLIYVNEQIKPDSSTHTVVQKWTDIANQNYSSLGFDAAKVLIRSGEPLDGHETAVRSGTTNLTRMVMAGMADAVPEADVVLLNAGSIRVDDVLPPPVTEYDIIRTLPFGGVIREADVTGSLLLKTLDQGRKNAGIGGYLLYNDPVAYDTAANTWKIKGVGIDASKTYRIAALEFLLMGKEAHLEFLHAGNPDMIKLYDADTTPKSSKSDVRLAIVRYLEKK